MKRFLILLSLSFTILVNNLNGQSLYLDYTDLDVALENPKDVKRLTMRFDESVNWLIEHAAKFTTLKQLRLHRADLSNRSLPFEHLSSLESLELVECELSSVPKGILKLSKLKKLDLSRNRKMNLELLQDLDQLESLTLRFTPIDERKEYIGNWPSLKVLVLDDNELTVFPEKICELSKLRGLFLENLWLSKLPENIGCLRNLEVLDISQNNLSSFPKSMKRLKKLRKLKLSKMNVNYKQLKTITKFRRLEELNLWNSLHLADSKSEANSSSSLIIKEEELFKLLKKLKRLKYLNLGNNQIENLPSYWQQQLERGITVVY